MMSHKVITSQQHDWSAAKIILEQYYDVTGTTRQYQRNQLHNDFTFVCKTSA